MEKQEKKKMIRIHLASHLLRKKGLLKRISEILPQLPEDGILQIFLNNYPSSIKDELPKDNRLGIILAGTYIHGHTIEYHQYPDLNSFGKLYNLNKCQKDDYFISIDDDIIYGPNFVNYMIEGCKKYNNRYIVTLHGSRYTYINNGQLAGEHVRDNRELLSYEKCRDKDEQVFGAGMGITCFNPFYIKMKEQDVIDTDVRSGDDESIQLWAQKHECPIICLKNKEGLAKADPELYIISPLYANTICVNLASNKLKKWTKWHLPTKDQYDNYKKGDTMAEEFSITIDNSFTDKLNKVISSEVLAAIVVDKIIKKESLSVVRVSDGEGFFIRHGMGENLHGIISSEWQKRYGVDGYNLRQLGKDLKDMNPDYLCPAIAGIYLQSFNLWKYYDRSVYGDWSYNYAWATFDRYKQIFGIAQQVLVLHHNANKVCENLFKKYNKTIFLPVPLNSWRDHEQVKEIVRKSKAHLILVSGGPSGKPLCCKMAKDYNKICLDMGEWMTTNFG